MAVGRRAAAGAALVLLLVASACSSPQANRVRHSVATTSTPTTSAPTTTTLPSAVPTTVPTPVVPTVGWSRPATTLPPAGGFTSVSCISVVFCLATGGGSNEADAADATGPGVIASWDGAAWSASATYFATAPGNAPPPWLPAISCTGGPLCAVVDGSGHTTLGDGTTWSPPAPLAAASAGSAGSPNPADPGPGHQGSRSAAVSCPSSQFCAYVDNTGHVATLHGRSWSALQAFTTRVGTSTVALFQSGRVGVSCTGPSWCTAMVGASVLDFDGTSWSVSDAPWTSGPTSGDTAVSCPMTRVCIAVHGFSVSVRLPGSAWSTPRAVDGNGSLDSVSCPTIATCTAADAYGNVIRSTGTTWTAPQKVIPTASSYGGDGTSVSCPSEQFCMVLNGDGDFATYQGVTPPTPTTTLPAVVAPTGP